MSLSSGERKMERYLCATFVFASGLESDESIRIVSKFLFRRCHPSMARGARSPISSALDAWMEPIALNPPHYAKIILLCFSAEKTLLFVVLQRKALRKTLFLASLLFPGRRKASFLNLLRNILFLLLFARKKK